MDTPSKGDLLDNLSDIILNNAHNPRTLASRTLEWMRLQAKARAIALWREDAEGHRALEFGLELDQEVLTNAETLWLARDGGPPAVVTVSGTLAVFIPTRGFPDSWTHLDGIEVDSIDAEEVAMSAAVAVKALRKVRGSPRLASELQAEELRSTLHRYEWNVSRVARARGVTRKTIYDQMARFGIARQHVPK